MLIPYFYAQKVLTNSNISGIIVYDIDLEIFVYYIRIKESEVLNMLHITKKIGCQYAVYDDEDGTLEWVSQEELSKAKELGLKFNTDTVVVDKSDCNFGKNGENIFASNPVYTYKGKDTFEMKACGKKFKFKLSAATITFTVGISVRLDDSLRVVLSECSR